MPTEVPPAPSPNATACTDTGREVLASSPPGRLYFHTDLFSYLPHDPGTGKILLERNENGIAVARLPVLPEGQFEHPYYGTLTWDRAKFAQMRENFHNHVMGSRPFLGIDHERMNFFSARAPAAGWITDLEHDAAARMFLTHIELTPLGEENIADRLYRYTSAEVADTYRNSRGEEYENVLAGNTLTNSPFHDTMPGLFGSVPTRAVTLSTRGPHTLWAPGVPMTADEIRRIWPGLDFPLISTTNRTTEEASMARRETAPETTDPVAEPTPEPEAAPVVAASGTADGEVVLTGFTVAPAAMVTASGVSDSISLSREQYEEMQRQIALGVQANAMLMEQTVRSQVEAQIVAGRSPRSKEAALFNLWMAAPEEAAAYFNEELPAIFPIARVGFAGGGAGTPDRDAARGGKAGSDFEELVMQIRQQNQGLSMTEAMSQARTQNPEAHRAYVNRNKKTTNGNGRS